MSEYQVAVPIQTIRLAEKIEALMRAEVDMGTTVTINTPRGRAAEIVRDTDGLRVSFFAGEGE